MLSFRQESRLMTRLCSPFLISNRLTVLNETWCKRHADRGQPNAISFDILQSVIIWRVYQPLSVEVILQFSEPAVPQLWSMRLGQVSASLFLSSNCKLEGKTIALNIFNALYQIWLSRILFWTSQKLICRQFKYGDSRVCSVLLRALRSRILCESVSRSQMDIKRKTYDIQKNICFSTYPPPTLIHLSRRFTSASKPTAWKSFDCCLSHFRTWSGIIRDFRTSLREFLDQIVNRFTRQTLPTLNRKQSLLLKLLQFHSTIWNVWLRCNVGREARRLSTSFLPLLYRPRSLSLSWILSPIRSCLRPPSERTPTRLTIPLTLSGLFNCSFSLHCLDLVQIFPSCCYSIAFSPGSIWSVGSGFYCFHLTLCYPTPFFFWAF
jgi:hypothetical protein